MDVRNKLEQMKEQLQSQKETYVRNKGIYDSKLQELNDVFGFKNLEEAQINLNCIPWLNEKDWNKDD